MIVSAAKARCPQTTYATITGTVTDPSGAVVQGAQVSAQGVQNKDR